MATFITPSSSETVEGSKVGRRVARSEKVSVRFLNRLGHSPIGGLICLAIVVGWFPAFRGQHLLAQTQTTGQSAAVHWLPLADCPVQSQNVVEVPAKDTGLLEKLEVELNATVKRGQTLATLEQELTDIELKIAKLQHAVAVEQAADDGEVRLRKLALKAAEELLASNTEIAKSVAASELRKMQLDVASAGVQVQNAERAMKRAGVQAELAAAAVQSAKLRLDNRQILAPMDGIVTDIRSRAGQWVETGKTILVISDLQALQVDGLIPFEKVDLKRVVGLEVRVETTQQASGSKPVRLAGRITSYDPEVSGKGLVRVHCRIQNIRQGEHWLLMPGMTVKLEVAVPAQTPGQSPALISRQPGQSSNGR